jgi:predicted RNase H-like HicB family nuclease
MKKIMLALMCAFGMFFMGCQNPDQKQVIIMVTRIAENHLTLEQTLAEQQCAKAGATVCPKAEQYGKWVASLALIEGYLKAETPEEASAAIQAAIDSLVADMMVNHSDPRSLMYVNDVRTIFEIMLTSIQNSKPAVVTP